MPTHKIVHISDLHIGANEAKDCPTCDKLTDFIIQAESPDSVIVITGDLNDSVGNADIVKLAIDQVQKLQTAFGKERVLVIPGNHDYATKEKGLGHGLDLGHHKCVEQFKINFFGDATVSYPKVDTFGDVTFLGLDSADEATTSLDCLPYRGKIGDSQRAALETKLAELNSSKPDQKKVVYLHHHPLIPSIPGNILLDTMYLVDRKDFMKLLHKYHVDLLLYGHIHSEECFGDGKELYSQVVPLDRVDLIFNAGSSTNVSNDPTWAACYRVIDLAAQTNTLKVLRPGWALQKI